MHLMMSQLFKFDGEPSFPHTCHLFLANLINQLHKSSCPIYQHICAKFEWPGGGLGKPKISWSSNLASRDGYKAEKRAQKEVWHTWIAFYNIFNPNSQPKLFQFLKAHILPLT
jgi:hypothetical protein